MAASNENDMKAVKGTLIFCSTYFFIFELLAVSSSLFIFVHKNLQNGVKESSSASPLSHHPVTFWFQGH